MSDFKLTGSQRAAVDAFKVFLDGPDQVFMLKGAAGTGKTTIVSQFLNVLESANRKFSLMAPTGRAAYILGSKTGKSATTIHRLIYCVDSLGSIGQNKDSEDDGGLFVNFKLKVNKDAMSTVYIVDEASMVSDSFSSQEAFSFGSGRLMADLFEYTRGRKIVFVGDQAQLSPVGMNFSPALDCEYIEHTYDCTVTEVVLREFMRQHPGSVMLDNANAIKDSIESKCFIEFSLREGEDSKAENDDLLRPYFALSQANPDAKSAIIAYSNSQALKYNQAIRRHYFGEDAPHLCPGDLLMIARNNYAYNYELFNGNIVKVETCASDGDVECRSVNVKLRKDRVESVVLRFRKALLTFNAGGAAASVSVNLLDNFLDDPNGSLGGLLSRALVIDFEKRLSETFKKQLPQIKKNLRSGSALSSEQKEIYDAYLNLLRTDPYYNAVVCKYGYALTCHKAQGGEWDNVFVDMGRFGGTANEEYFRWAYTALTRASKKLWHFRSPEFNYISNLIVEPIQESKNLKVSTYSANSDFCSARFQRLMELAENAGVSVSDDKSKSYQHRFCFSDDAGHSVVISASYGDKGYNGRTFVVKSDFADLEAIADSLLKASYVPQFIPYANAERPFAEKLVTYLKSLFEELDIQLLDISAEQYCDVFHLKTDGLAKVCIYYDKNGRYTYMKPISSLGAADAKLEAFRQQFI